jgi:integrase/recombinase XerD
MDSLVSVPALTGHAQTRADRLRLAALAYLARYKGQSRDHAASDLRGYLIWCADRSVDPLAATRVQIELWVRWMQETRGLRPERPCRAASRSSLVSTARA